MVLGRRNSTAARSVIAGLLVVLAVSFAGVHPLSAAATASTERVKAELLADAAAVQPGQTFRVALRLDIADGWHTYWRNPGDSGEPTHIDWRLPPGVEASEIRWPAPERIPYGPLVNFGYHGRVMHLVEMTLPGDWPADRPLDLQATASWLVCKDICIPEQADLSLTLPGWRRAARIRPPRRRLQPPWRNCRSRIPARGSDLPAAAGAGAGVDAPADALVLRLADGDAFGDTASAYFFPDAWGAVDPVAPQRLERTGDGLTLVMTSGSEPPAEALSGVLVINPEAARGDPARRAFAISAERADVAAGSGAGRRRSRRQPAGLSAKPAPAQ